MSGGGWVVSEYVGGGLLAFGQSLEDGIGRERLQPKREVWDAQQTWMDD